MTKTTANQCKYNIKLNAQTLVSIANETSAHINDRGSSTSSEKEQVVSAQKRLRNDILLGIANELTMQDVREVIKNAVDGIELSEGAEMAIEHVLESSEAGWRRLKDQG